MEHDGIFQIAVGASYKSKKWKNKKVKWSDFVNTLKTPTVTQETFNEFIKASKEDQLKIKDVGGYVGAYLRGGKRHPQNVLHKQLITLDIDEAYPELWEDFCMLFDVAALVHSTHKHCPAKPRLRILIPINREVAVDEYVAIARKVAEFIGIDIVDNSTFDVNRLMFYPSVPKDMEYYFQYQDGEWLDADEILDYYIDWKDTAEWSTSKKIQLHVNANIGNQENPENKRGVVGAFCRTYTIEETIETHLSDVYESTALTGRYTYKDGTTIGGLVTYENKFSFSHHGTDPAGGRLCNAFDLVRIHKFSHLDTTQNEMASFKAMENYARNDEQVKRTIARELLDQVKYDFADDEEEPDEDDSEKAIEWMKNLESNSRSEYLSTANNIDLILNNDKYLKDNFRLNTFDSKRYVMRTTAWRKILSPEPMKNVDYSGVRNYIESVYKIVSSFKIDDSLALIADKNSYHPIREYIQSLEWDGIERVDTLLADYFGAPNTEYTTQAIRKTLVGAIARVFEPGIKFDLVLTLVGEKGVFKSTFIRKLGMDWHSDSFMTVKGKEAFEQLQGAWIIEIAELAGFKKAEVEAVKHYITKQIDQYRPAYGRTIETFKRQCIFIATTNDDFFLAESDRRYLPIKVNINAAIRSFDQMDEDEVNQIWAEAYQMYLNGEKLYLEKNMQIVANAHQQDHTHRDEREGVIQEYLDTPIPEDWEDLSMIDRVTYMNDPLNDHKGNKRKQVCVPEIWCECLGKSREDMDRYKTRGINNILNEMSEWKLAAGRKRFKIYGIQRYYERIKQNGQHNYED